MMSVIAKLLNLLEVIGKYGAMILMMTCMMIVSADVIFRYLLAMPLHWSNDVLTLYVLPGIFYLGLPASYTALSHVSVDLILSYSGPRLTLLLSAVSRIAAIAVFSAITWYAWHRFVEAVARGEVVPGPQFDWPVWPGIVIMPFAALIISVRALERLGAELYAITRPADCDLVTDALSRATVRGEMT